MKAGCEVGDLYIALQCDTTHRVLRVISAGLASCVLWYVHERC